MAVEKMPRGFESVRSWLSERCGIQYPAHKYSVLYQRLERLMHAQGIADVSALSALLHDDENYDLQLAVMHVASTNHTYFYREPEVLEQFVQVAAPGLAERDQIRIWSAACSTGEEAYTIAMLLAEKLGQSVLSRTAILGTDISNEVISNAENAIYPERTFGPMPPNLIPRYFRPHKSGTMQVVDALRQVCTFRRINLMQQPYPMVRTFQAVFLRNVLYYFERADQQRVLAGVWRVTEPGGYLVTSVTESVRELSQQWEQICPGLYRRVG